MIANFVQPRIDSRALDVYLNIWSNPWTRALRGKRLLIISSFSESLEIQAKHQSKLYGIDLFPECTFRFVTAPQTHAGNPARSFEKEMIRFRRIIAAEAEHFDVALCACGGYGAPICNYIHSTLGKSAIYVGGVLQMYFGLVGRRWEREAPDVLAAYKNKYWARPSLQERPEGHDGLEKSCYW